MRINFIIPFTSKTGGIKIVFEYANRLYDRGHDVIIYTPMRTYKFNYEGFYGLLRRIKSFGEVVLKQKTKVKWYNLKVPLKLVPIIKSEYIRDADAVIATAWPTAYDVYNLNNNKGKKVYFIQGYEIWSGKKEDVDGTYLLPLKQIVIANWLKELMSKSFNRTDIEIVYNGIDFDEYNNNCKSFNTKTVCMMYHSLDLKGYKDGLKAFEIVKSKFPDLKLILFGVKKGKGIPNYAEFYLNSGPEQLRKIYSKSDVFIFPSKFEGWGLTPLEAMACKCAVVGTNVGCLNEIGLNGENALISEPGDVEILAENLYKVLTNDILLRNISINGYNTVLNFSWDNSVEKFEKILNE